MWKKSKHSQLKDTARHAVTVTTAWDSVTAQNTLKNLPELTERARSVRYIPGGNATTTNRKKILKKHHVLR